MAAGRFAGYLPHLLMEIDVAEFGGREPRPPDVWPLVSVRLNSEPL
jgi:hypothetical protein